MKNKLETELKEIMSLMKDYESDSATFRVLESYKKQCELALLGLACEEAGGRLEDGKLIFTITVE